MARIDQIHLERPFLGSRRIAAELSVDGLVVNRKRVQRLMRMMGVTAILPEEIHQQAQPCSQDLSLPVARVDHRSAEPGLVCGHNLPSYGLGSSGRCNTEDSGVVVAERKYSDEQKQAVLAAVDRGSTVRAAAAAAGVSPTAGYRWVKQAGLSTSRSTPRKYAAEEKETFLRRVAEVRNISQVARELGINRVTAYSWAHRAGIFTSDDANERKKEFLRLRQQGVERVEAARRLGIEAHQASDWDRGIRSFAKGRIYPDGRVVVYNQDEILANVRRPRTTWAQGEHICLERVEQVIDSRYLSLVERERIKDLQAQGCSIRKIASLLERSPSTISRELRRNVTSKGEYLPHTAHRLSVKRRFRPKTAKLTVAGPLQDYVSAKLKKRWSPEQIAHRLRKDHPDDAEMRVCTETIYQAIYVHAKGELKRELAASLRRGRSRRKTRKSPTERSPRSVDEITPIAQRPSEVDDRALPGHWEGDLITGTQNRSAVATLVERNTRYVLLGHLPTDHGAQSVRESLTRSLKPLPEQLRLTLTWDQGAEMAEHKAFTIATDIDVYFCDPASPWQRGTNENTNGLLRQYLPKGKDLRQFTPEQLETIAEELNTRPRKSLDWDTPSERLSALLEAT